MSSSMKLLLRPSPRALILTSSLSGSGLTRALVISVPDRTSTQVRVEFIHDEDIDMSEVRTLRSIHGTLGIVDVASELFLVVVTKSNGLGTILPNEGARLVTGVEFFSLSSSTYDDVMIDPTTGRVIHPGDFMEGGEQLFAQGPAASHPCEGMRRLLETGNWYFADNSSTSHARWDISTRLTARISREQIVIKKDPQVAGAGRGPEIDAWDAHDDRFVWNINMSTSLLDWRSGMEPSEKIEFDACRFLILLIQGYIGISPLSLGSSLVVISRLGWKRAGTRFLSRGIDDLGRVANFVETETIYTARDSCFSFVQVRGSVPLFWEQVGVQAFGQKIQVVKPFQAAHPAFMLHVQDLLKHYSSLEILNLLGNTTAESTLTASFSSHLNAAVKEIGSDFLCWDNLDFHTLVKALGHSGFKQSLLNAPGLLKAKESFGFTMVDLTTRDLIMQQQGIVRTNCLDCLDRTNVCQELLSRQALEIFLESTTIVQGSSESLWAAQRHLWAENGDALSKSYTGSGAINSSFTRSGKKTLAGMLADATKSVGRAYTGLVLDSGKQTSIDQFLCQLADQRTVIVFDPVQDLVRSRMSSRIAEYAKTWNANVWVGTFNLGGALPTGSFMPWLFPLSDAIEPDIFAICLQEIVELTANQILSTDSSKRRQWETYLVKSFANRSDAKHEYLLLRSEQLVGVALFVFIKSELATFARNVEGTTKKCGLGGMAGNKGGVSIRLQLHDTTLCFVSCHLAAHQTNVDERDADYRDLSSNMSFSRGRSIASHDAVFWAGDLNYRIDGDGMGVRQLVALNRLDQLYEDDQLRDRRQSKVVFSGYREERITFPPTYKFDIQSDDYDTSEKARIPAWTDRILYKGESVACSQYDCVKEIKISDHRPVYGYFQAKITDVNAKLQSDLREQLLHEASIEIHGANRLKDEPNLWWIDEDHPEGDYRQALQDPQIDRDSNPFDESQKYGGRAKKPPLPKAKKPAAPVLPLSLQDAWKDEASPQKSTHVATNNTAEENEVNQVLITF